jgi:Ca2+-binding EF-hand superfamily protein
MHTIFQLIHVLIEGDSAAIIRAIFKVIDDDRSGTIEKDEYISTIVVSMQQQ